MEKPIIYSAIEHCPHCNKDVTINLHSDDPHFLDKAPGLKKEVSIEGMHNHWFYNHRVCAKCGLLIKQGQGWWALADKVAWPLNETYIEWTHKSGLQVLDVHRGCIEPLRFRHKSDGKTYEAQEGASLKNLSDNKISSVAVREIAYRGNDEYEILLFGDSEGWDKRFIVKRLESE